MHKITNALLALALCNASADAFAQDCRFQPTPERSIGVSGAQQYEVIPGTELTEGIDPVLETSENVAVRDVARIRSPNRELYEIVRYDAVNLTGLLRNCQFLWFWDIGGPPASRHLELRLVGKDADFPEADLLKRPFRQPTRIPGFVGYRHVMSEPATLSNAYLGLWTHEATGGSLIAAYFDRDDAGEPHIIGRSSITFRVIATSPMLHRFLEFTLISAAQVGEPVIIASYIWNPRQEQHP